MSAADPDESKGERAVLRYQLRIKGVFGRNRSIKTQTLTLVKECPPDKPKTLDELLPLMRDKLAEIKFKGGWVSIDEDPITLRPFDRGDGKIGYMESFMLFSNKTLHREKIEGGGVVFGSS